MHPSAMLDVNRTKRKVMKAKKCLRSIEFWSSSETTWGYGMLDALIRKRRARYTVLTKWK